MNNLNLHFNGNISTEFESELRKVSPVEFTAVETEPDPRDILTKPEFAKVCKILKLSFNTDADCREFMKTTKCREVYDRFCR